MNGLLNKSLNATEEGADAIYELQLLYRGSRDGFKVRERMMVGVRFGAMHLVGCCVGVLMHVCGCL